MRLGYGKTAGRAIGGGRSCRAALLLGLAAGAPAAAQTATPAGTVVANTAELHWTIGGVAGAARSNTDRLIVAERLDVRLVAAPSPPAGSTGFDLVNAGSGTEAFVAAAASPDDPSPPLAVAVDLDGDGRCDPAVDRVLADGRTDPLAPGATLRLVACGAGGAVRIVARAVTGSGAPGTGFDGQGDGGGDAVVGPTGAAATLLFGAGEAGAAPVLLKSQTALASDGGAVITYTLLARFGAAAAAAEIDDPLPAGTSPVPGSLVLDGVALSDAADADAGEVAGGAVRVRLGDVPAGTDRRVTFAVTVNP